MVTGTPNSCGHFRRDFLGDRSTDAFTPAQVSARVDGFIDRGLDGTGFKKLLLS